jgi:hypothetical protein
MRNPVDLTNTLPNNLTTNMGANNVANANTAPMFNYGDALEYFTYPGTTFNKGGRVGYRTAGPVLGEDEGSENIIEFMQDQGVPFGEMVEEEPTEEEKAMVIDMDSRGNDTDTISTITGLSIDTINKILGIELAQGGIARLL